MKFTSKDPFYFSKVSEELFKENPAINVVHLRYWEDTEGKSKNHRIVVDDSLEPKELVEQVYSKQISHFVQHNESQFSEDLKRAGDLIQTPSTYFQSQTLVISPVNITTKQILFSQRSDKDVLISQVEEFLELVRSTPAREAAMAAIEELFMNAMIDAPKESKRLGFTATNTECELFLAFNQDTLQISCSDPYGSLDLKKLFARLYEVYQKGAGDAIDLRGMGGAGIGCYLLLEQCRSLIFGVRKGVQTKVTCLIPRVASRREYAKFKKSLHGFEVDE